MLSRFAWTKSRANEAVEALYELGVGSGPINEMLEKAGTACRLAIIGTKIRLYGYRAIDGRRLNALLETLRIFAPFGNVYEWVANTTYKFNGPHSDPQNLMDLIIGGRWEELKQDTSVVRYCAQQRQHAEPSPFAVTG